MSYKISPKGGYQAMVIFVKTAWLSVAIGSLIVKPR
jgi:hypothetical protein